MSSVALGSAMPNDQTRMTNEIPSTNDQLGFGNSKLNGHSRPPWTYYETIGGGSGASFGHNGAHAIQCHMTNTLNTPAEAIELQYPLRVRRFERAKNSGGAGKFTGGDGIVREIEALSDCEGTILSDRRATKPFGLSGGSPAKSGENKIISNSEVAISGKAKFALRAGDRLRIQTPGGGGWGTR
jgi:N-methylhydantoinase B